MKSNGIYFRNSYSVYLHLSLSIAVWIVNGGVRHSHTFPTQARWRDSQETPEVTPEWAPPFNHLYPFLLYVQHTYILVSIFSGTSLYKSTVCICPPFVSWLLIYKVIRWVSAYRGNNHWVCAVTKRLLETSESHMRSSLCFTIVSRGLWIKAGQCNAVHNTIMRERTACRNCEKGFVTGFHECEKRL